MAYSYKYPHPAVTTDNVIFGYDHKDGLSVLLIQRGIEPFKGSWAFPGGFFQIDPSSGIVDFNTEACARRELKEETGLETAHVEEIGCFSDIGRDPRERVISIAYFALVRKEDVKGGDDAADARWFPLDEIPDLAFDHEKILKAAIERMRQMIYFKPIGFELLPEVFTMPELQDLYERILGRTFDRRNFAAKIMKTGILTEIGRRPEGCGPRIPSRYSFNKEMYFSMKDRGFRIEF